MSDDMREQAEPNRACRAALPAAPPTDLGMERP